MANLNLDPRLVMRRINAAAVEDVFDSLGGALWENGYTRPTHRQALKDREAEFPTGLPVSGGVAIPHTDPEHVLRDTVGVATLARPVTFHEMGGAEGATVQVLTVIMLAFTEGDKHIEVLAKMIGCIQDEKFISDLHSAATKCAIVQLLQAKLDHQVQD